MVLLNMVRHQTGMDFVEPAVPDLLAATRSRMIVHLVERERERMMATGSSAHMMVAW